MEQILKCDLCERVAHNPSFKDKTCDVRLMDGRHCRGTLRLTEVEVADLEPHLICNDCGRRADKMDMEGKYCNWLLPDRHLCAGILMKAA